MCCSYTAAAASFSIKCLTYNVAEPCPSSVFQNHLREYLESDSEAATKVIDTMLNQLNWAFSEFVRILHEVVTDCAALIVLLKWFSWPFINILVITARVHIV